MIVLYRGARGRGKTLSMCREAHKYYLAGYKILSNFSLEFGEDITSKELLSLNRESKLFNCVLVIDEMQLFFDSRNFRKKENMDFSNFIQQIRKRNIIILCTTQYINTVDLRLRQHIDVVVYPKFYKEFNMCKVEYYDLTKLEDVNIENIKPFTQFYRANKYFNMYDTYEMLK